MNHHHVTNKKFEVDGLWYEFSATNGGTVMFYITHGATKYKSFDTDDFFFWEEEESVADGQYHRNAIKVLKKVKELLVEWIFTEKPYYFSVLASTDRKLPIYQWALRRLAKELEGHYMTIEEGEVFRFYKV